MRRRSYSQISDIAYKLLERNSIDAPFVDVFSIAKSLGLRIKPEQLADNISGFLVHKDGKHIIGVNSTHHPNRRRFTIALQELLIRIK